MLCPYLGSRFTIHTRTYKALTRVYVNKPVASPGIPHRRYTHQAPSSWRPQRANLVLFGAQFGKLL